MTRERLSRPLPSLTASARSRHSSDGSARWLRRGVAGLVLFAALAFGGVHGWASGVAELGIWSLALAWLSVRRRRPLQEEQARVPPPFLVAGAALCLYVALQALPLPRPLVAALSPAVEATYRRTIDAAAAIAEPPAPIRSVGRVEDEKVPAAERERIRGLASASGWLPASWRSLAPYPFRTRADFLVYVACGLVLWLAATLPRPAALVRALVFGGAAIALLALVEFVTWNGHVLWFFDPYDTGPLGDYPRMTGPFVNPDHFAAFLAMLVAPAAAELAAAFQRGRRHRRRGDEPEHRFLLATLSALGLAVMVAALVGSASRGGIVGATIGAAVVWRGAALGSREEAAGELRTRRRENRAQRLQRLLRRYGPAVLATTIVAAGLGYAGPRARSGLDARLAETVVSPDLHVRMLMWRQSLPMIADYPIFGVGAGCWAEAFRRYEAYPMVGYRPNHAHNDYVEWVVELGLVGVSLTVALAWAYGRWARRNRAMPRLARHGVLGAIAAIAWHEVFDFSLHVPANALLLAALLGVLCNPDWAGEEPPRSRRRARSAGGRLPSSRAWFDQERGGAPAALAEPTRSFDRESLPAEEAPIETVAMPAVAAPKQPRRAAGLAAASAGAFVVLAAMSVRQIREFTQWLGVRGGSPVLAFSPGDADTWNELGLLLYRSGFRYAPPTEECFRAALRLRPTSEQALWQLSLTATTYKAKLGALEAALFLDPTRAPWRLAYATLLDAVGRPAAAMAEVEEAVHRDPELEHHPYLNPRDERIGGKLLEAVERGFGRAVEEDPDDPALLDTVASFHYRFGHWRKAAELWSRAAQIGDAWGSYGVYAADAYAHLEQYDRAEAAARRAMGAASERPEPYRLLAMSVFRPQRRYGEAEETLRLGIRRTRDPAPLYVALYQLKSEEGDRKGAIEALGRAASANQRDPDLALELGVAYLNAEDYHRAKAALARAIALDAARAASHHYLGLALEKLYDLNGARAEYRRASELAPAEPAYAADVKRLDAAFAAAEHGG